MITKRKYRGTLTPKYKNRYNNQNKRQNESRKSKTQIVASFNSKNLMLTFEKRNNSFPRPSLKQLNNVLYEY